MQTLLEVLKKTTDYFDRNGVDNPRLNAEQLFAHVLGCKRLDLYLQFERPLEAELLDRLRPLVARRARREPLQYILGEWTFGDLTLATDSRALIPRPETEELVGATVELLGAGTPKRILDLGTGSGAIALALAAKYPDAEVVGVDASATALELAAANARRTGLEERVQLAQSDWLSAVDEQFDLIISNPPYLTEAEWTEAEPEVRDYEPKDALVAPDEGMAALKEIIQQAATRYLARATHSLLALETGIAQHQALRAWGQECGFNGCQSRQDLSMRDRFLFFRFDEF